MKYIKQNHLENQCSNWSFIWIMINILQIETSVETNSWFKTYRVRWASEKMRLPSSVSLLTFWTAFNGEARTMDLPLVLMSISSSVTKRRYLRTSAWYKQPFSPFQNLFFKQWSGSHNLGHFPMTSANENGDYQVREAECLLLLSCKQNCSSISMWNQVKPSNNMRHSISNSFLVTISNSSIRESPWRFHYNNRQWLATPHTSSKAFIRWEDENVKNQLEGHQCKENYKSPCITKYRELVTPSDITHTDLYWG